MARIVINFKGVLDSYGYLTSDLRYQLSKAAGKPVLLVVNSLGGDVNQGLIVSKMIEEHGDVIVRFIGCNASASTWMVYGAKSIEIAEDSFFLIHQCSNAIFVYKSMKVKDLDDKIKELQSLKKSQEAFNLIIAKKYFERAESKGKTFEDICKLMEEERWLTASEAAEWGLVDTVIPGINKMTKDMQNCIIQNCADMNLPQPSFPAENEERSLVAQIIDGIASIIKPTPANQENNLGTKEPETSQNVASTTDTNSNSNQNFMHKFFVNLIALLGIAANAQTEEKQDVTLTADQLQKVEDSLAELKTTKDTLTEVVNALDSVSDSIKAIDGAKNKVLALTALVNSFPAAAPAGNQVPNSISAKKAEDLKGVATDPINSEMQEFFNARAKR